MDAQKRAEGKIEAVLKKMSAAEVDELAPDRGEFKAIAEAVMAWYQLLLASGIVDRKDKRVIDVLAASLVVLGTLVKYAYALGVRRGQRGRGRPKPAPRG
jgi:hypothetical protein